MSFVLAQLSEVQLGCFVCLYDRVVLSLQSHASRSEMYIDHEMKETAQ
jgi:hypothetical protein